MKPSIVPATLHAPCAVDILVVFMSHFSLRLFNMEDDAWFNGSCILTRCWSTLAEIEDVSVKLPDGALCKPSSSTCRARYILLIPASGSPSLQVSSIAHSAGNVPVRDSSSGWHRGPPASCHLQLGPLPQRSKLLISCCFVHYKNIF